MGRSRKGFYTSSTLDANGSCPPFQMQNGDQAMDILIKFTLTSEDVTSILISFLPRLTELLIYGTVAIVIAIVLLRPIIRAQAEKKIIRQIAYQTQVQPAQAQPAATEVISKADEADPKIVQLSLRVPQHKAEQIKELINQIDQQSSNNNDKSDIAS